MIIGYVFGYGSLAHPRDWALRNLPALTRYTFLRDHRRTWDVGIDNSSSLRDHKHYCYPDGTRADLVISTLGIYHSPGSRCNGLLLPVDARRLELLDQRELSYTRKEVGEFIDEVLELPAWTYFPAPETLELFAEKHQQARLPRSYYDTCVAAFRHWRGENEFWQSTDQPNCAQEELHLHRAHGLAGL